MEICQGSSWKENLAEIPLRDTIVFQRRCISLMPPPPSQLLLLLAANKSHAFFPPFIASLILWPVSSPYFLSKQRLQLVEHMTSPVCLTFGGPRQTLLYFATLYYEDDKHETFVKLWSWKKRVSFQAIEKECLWSQCCGTKEFLNSLHD